jgi:hypothetical protein
MPLTTVDQGLLSTNAQYTGFKNRIINGQMQIDQRNNGVLQTSIGNNFFITDRFSYQRSGLGITAAFNCQQSSTAPTGYSYSAFMTATTGQTLGASGGRYMVVRHAIEGFNLADVLRNQDTVTLSFYVYASNAGTYSLVFKNSAGNSSYATTYSVTSSNTWQLVTVTFAINTSSGTWNYTTGTGLEIFWVLDADDDVCASSNNSWVSGSVFGANSQAHGRVTTNSTFYITGVQLEKGSTATSFDYRPIGTELQLCQRYYEVATIPSSASVWVGAVGFAGSYYVYWNLKVTKRASPTLSLGPSASWIGATAIGYAGLDIIQYYESTSFYLSGSSGVVGTIASAEL